MKIIKTKKLVSTFKNSLGQKHNLIIKNPTVDKSAEEIREALVLLTTLDIFEEENGVRTYAEIETCKYVETIKYVQFDQEYPVDESKPPVVPENPVDAPNPASCLNPFKALNYGKFVELECPKVLELEFGKSAEFDTSRVEGARPIIHSEETLNVDNPPDIIPARLEQIPRRKLFAKIKNSFSKKCDDS